MSLFSVIGNAVSSFFKKEAPIVVNAFTSASSIINVVKTFLGSATGQTLEAIIEALVPGVSIPVFTALNEFFVGYGIVSTEVAKPISEIAADGLNAISKLTGNNKILALSNVASIVGHAISTANNGGSTLQQAIVALPLVYKPDLLDDGVIVPVPVVNEVAAQNTFNFIPPATAPVDDVSADASVS